MSRTQNSIRNIKVSLGFQVASVLMTFLTRRVFVQILSREYLGLNGTFSSILSMLSLAELGIGSAITYSLYKPLAEQDEEQVAALMALFRRAYWIIGLVVATPGAALTPLLPVLVRDLPDIPHIYLIYLLFVLNSASSYFFSYKQSLMIADQRQYITTACHYGLGILLQLSQAVFLMLTRNYFVYLGIQIGMTLLQNVILSFWADRLYPYLKAASSKGLNPETKRDIVRNVKALLFHQLGGAIVFGTDNLLISFFVGAVAVGMYSNYRLVENGLQSLYVRLFRSLTASVGNLGATSDSEHALSVFWRVNLVGNWLFGFSAICLAVLFNPFIVLWLGEEYLLSQWIVCFIALNFYMRGMRRTVMTFREAYGLYWYDRYKPVAECIVNLFVSILLAAPYGIAGILAGTFVSTITTCFWIEPIVLFKHCFYTSARPFFRECAVNMAVTLLTAMIVWSICSVLPGDGFLLFVEKVGVCAVVGNLGYLAAYHRRDEFGYFVRLIRYRKYR